MADEGPGEETVLRLVRGELAKANRSLRTPQTVAQQAGNQAAITMFLVLVTFGIELNWPVVKDYPAAVTAAATGIAINVLTIVGKLLRNLSVATGLARWIG